MFREEADGRRIDKRAFRESLRPLLSGRSDGAIERKHSNISAVLEEANYAWMNGYKPLRNYQGLLREAVLTRALSEATLFERLMARREISPGEGAEFDLEAIFVSPPKRQPVDTAAKQRLAPRKYDHAARDTAARALGRRGEEWVVELERRRLIFAGRGDLSGRVRWISDIDGDRAGYDIASFESDGSEIFIEVKTTNGPAETPFLVSSNEVQASKLLGPAFCIYRVFAFSSEPRVFILKGDVSLSCALSADVYRANPSHL